MNPSAKVQFYDVDEIDLHRKQSARSYEEFLRRPAMSAGLYVLPVGGVDPQKPHHEGEVYYVVRGKARFKADTEDQPVAAGSVIFVAAEVEHRFYDITEELQILVFFAPAESE